MYSHTLRAATSSGTALGRFGGGIAGGAAAGLVVPGAGAARGRSVSATSAAGAPLPGVGMEQPKQQPAPPQAPPQDAGGGDKDRGDDAHFATGDAMAQSFGVAYSTRSDEEGFGGVYGGSDPAEAEHSGTEIHASHSEYYVHTRDVMAHSFGVEYSTRSEEEGFGVVYGGSDLLEVEHPGTEATQPSRVRHDAGVEGGEGGKDTQPRGP